MSPKIYNATILVLFLALMVQTFLPRENKCPDPPAPTIDTSYITKVDTIYIPGDTVFQEKVIYRPQYISQKPAPKPVPQVISNYSDTLRFDQEMVEVIYNATTHGTLQQLRLKARSTATRVVKISSTYYITKEREVEKKVYPTRFYVGGGIGGSKQMLDDVNLSALLTTSKHAYGLDYDLVDKTVEATLYFKLF